LFMPLAVLCCCCAACPPQGFSSGEELDELGELGSSDNEQERFLQVRCSIVQCLAGLHQLHQLQGTAC
jgi:hypothetical protein